MDYKGAAVSQRSGVSHILACGVSSTAAVYSQTSKRGRTKMPDAQTRTTLYRSASLTVVDFAWRAYAHRAGREEAIDAHAVVFVRAGAFVRSVGRESTLADPTQVLFFTKEQPYRVEHPICGGDECTIIKASPQILLEVMRHRSPRHCGIPDAPLTRTHRASTSRAMLLHYALLIGLRHRELPCLAVHELVLELLDEVLRADSPSPVPPVSRAQRDLVAQAKMILWHRYQAPPSLEDFAQILTCSPFHLCRSFSRIVGMPMHRYLDRLRLRLSLVRLTTGESDLTNLALDLGYADHSHFTNAFRREFGLAPSTFRGYGARNGSSACGQVAPTRSWVRAKR